MKKNSCKYEFFSSRFVLALIICMLFSAVSVVLPAYSGEMINSVTRGGGDVWKYVLLFAGIGLLQYAMSVLRQVTEGVYQSSQKRTMRSNAFSFFLHEKDSSKEKRAEAVSFVNNDIPVIVGDFYLGYINLAGLFCVIGLTITALFVIHWILAVIIVSSSLLILLIPHSHKKGSAASRTAYSSILSTYNAGFLSFLEGMSIIKVFRYFTRAFQNEEEKNKNAEKAELNVLKFQWLVYNWTALVQIAKNVLLLVAGVILIKNGQILVGDLVAVIQLAELIASPIEVLAYVIQAMNAARPLRENYVSMLRVKETPIENSLPEGESAIEISNLSYEIEGITILKNINIRFEGKKKYLLVGESGSGKSTLLNLIAGLGSADYTGSLKYSGVELRDLDKEAYYEKLAIDFQEPYLFQASLKENILLGREINDSEFERIIEKLNLQYLLDRYGGTEIDASVLEKLSGGEKQRVALARTLIGKPAILLLDEVTASLDKQNAEIIEKVILAEDAMVIHVSHRTDSEIEKLYDCVIIMSAGKIAPETNTGDVLV